MPLVSFCKTPGCLNRADYVGARCFHCFQRLKAEHGKAQQTADPFAAGSVTGATPTYKCLSDGCTNAVDRPGRACGRCARGHSHETKVIDPVLISDDVLRLFLLDPRNRTRVKDLMLTPGDDLLLQSVAKGHNTSSKIASLNDTSVQSISLRLTSLRQRGYLTRVSAQQESGGYEWIYTNVYKQKETNNGQ